MSNGKSSVKTEKKAVNVIENMIDDINYLDHEFTVGDKGKTWDGYIYTYIGNVDEKKNFLDSLPVQIKGRSVHTKKFKEKTEFKVDKVQLKNFKRNDGALYFVVLMNDYDEKVAYYCPLLPYDLNKLLNSTFDDKDEIKIKLKRLKDCNHLEKIVRDFSKDRNEQKKISEFVFNQDKVLINNQPSRLCFYDWNKGQNSLIDYIGKEKYVYQYDAMDNIIGIFCGSIFAVEEKKKISVKNKKSDVLYTDCVFGVSEDVKRLSFGKAFELISNRKENSKNDLMIKGDLKIQVNGTLKERMGQLDFIMDIANDEGFYINNDFYEVKMKEENKAMYSAIHKGYNKINQFLINHNIQKDLNLDMWEDSEIRDLLVWIDAIDNHHPVQINGLDILTIGSIKIKDLRFSAYADKRPEGGFYVYSLWNYGKVDKNTFYTYAEGGHFVKTKNIYSVITEQAYLADDINIDEMKKSFEKYGISENEEVIINYQVLELIKAYDKSKNEQLLEYALYLLDMIEKSEFIEDIAFINKCQIYKRQEVLKTDDKIRLIEIRDLYEDEFYKISTNLLIDNVTEAEIIFSKMSEDKKELYLKFPIAYFLKNSCRV